MLIIAHRGASSLEPENTIRSFKRAESLGADMIEFDVRESQDGELVVIHDRGIDRLFDQDYRVADLTLMELKELSAGREIPTLAEVVEAVKIPINVHVKVHGIELKLLNTLKNFTSEVLISSTYPGVLKKIRALDAKVRLGLIVGRGELHLIPIINWLTKSLPLYSIHPKLEIVNFASVALLKLLNRKIYVWGVNTQKDMDRSIKLKVDGVFTDYPQLFTNVKSSGL